MENLVFSLIIISFFAVVIVTITLIMALISKKFRDEFINDWKGN